MTLDLIVETDEASLLPGKEIPEQVIRQVLEAEGCPFAAQISLQLVDDDTIRRYNAAHRHIDSATDVLSFPLMNWERPAGFSSIDKTDKGIFDPDTGELCLGDIVISVPHVLSQAEAYGHSITREYAFLVAHSMLHLLGYDHMNDTDAAVMEEKQEMVLKALGISRDQTERKEDV